MYLPIKLVIADDHEVYRDGLKVLLEKSKGINIIGEAANGMELVRICEQETPDVVMTDIMMPEMDGIEATKQLLEHNPSIRVIALSMFNQDNLVVDMLKAGAIGYMIKNASKREIIEAIESAYRNAPYYCRSTSLKLAKLIGSSRLANGDWEKAYFSEKEIAIIKMICEEKNTREIAEKLHVSVRTAEDYRDRIREKMKVKNVAGIVMYAVREKLYSIADS